MRHYDYIRPQSLDDVWKLKEKIPDARFVAGGTDLMVQIKNRDLLPSALISLRAVPELSSVKVNEGVHIGALTTIRDIIQNAELQNHYPVLVEAAKKLGSVQIRNVATIGGNLCNGSPCADMAIPLLVLEANVKLQTSKTSRDIPLNQFFVGPGETCLSSDEILTEIVLEPPHQNEKATFLKIGRVKMDLAIASVAVLLKMEGERCCKARISAGSVAPVPLRLSNVEALLEGNTLSKKLVDEAQNLAADSVSPITDVRATKEYRRYIIGLYLKRGLEKILGWSHE